MKVQPTNLRFTKNRRYKTSHFSTYRHILAHLAPRYCALSSYAESVTNRDVTWCIKMPEFFPSWWILRQARDRFTKPFFWTLVVFLRFFYLTFFVCFAGNHKKNRDSRQRSSVSKNPNCTVNDFFPPPSITYKELSLALDITIHDLNLISNFWPICA